MNMDTKIKMLVQNNNKAVFQYYRDGSLWYKVMDFLFPVPIADTKGATFNVEEKALLLMRYIRKHMQTAFDATP